MGAIVSAPLACLAGCGGSCLGMCCGKLVGTGSVESVKGSKYMFFGLQAFGVILLLLLRFAGQSMFQFMPKSFGVGVCEGDASCWEDQMTYRVSFSVAVIMAILLFLSLIGMQKTALLHFWFLKFMTIPVLTFATLFMPNSMFDVVNQVATVSAMVFILAQMVLLYDFGHAWNNHWLAECLEDQRRDMNSSGKRWVAGILCFAIGFLVFAITTSAMCHTSFQTTYAKVTIWVNFGIGAVLVLLSTLSVIANGSILPSALVFAYTTYVAWDACLSIPFPSHEPVKINPLANEIVGFIFLALAMGSFVRDPKIFNFSSDRMELESSDEEAPVSEEGASSVKVNWLSTCIFFTIHTLATLYVITLFGGAHESKVLTSYWVLNVAIWIMLLLFAVSLFAPLILSERDFGH